MSTIKSKFQISIVSEADFIPKLAAKLQQMSDESIKARGSFLIGVSGGSVIDFLAQVLPSLHTNFKLWTMFLCDERIVPPSSPHSTFGLYAKNVFPLIPSFPSSNFININHQLESSSDIADDYEEKLRNIFKNRDDLGDCLMLGVGPDGHTCSLFPSHPVLNVSDRWVSFLEDSPKEPPKRITLTYEFINKSNNIIVAGKGKEKLEIAKKVEEGVDLPIGRINNGGRNFEWILSI